MGTHGQAEVRRLLSLAQKCYECGRHVVDGDCDDCPVHDCWKRPERQTCSRCGCASHFDRFGDRLCWCDACEQEGCLHDGSGPRVQRAHTSGGFETSDARSSDSDMTWEVEEEIDYDS